jgi:two-component system sensor histidine kinase AlgZ
MTTLFFASALTELFAIILILMQDASHWVTVQKYLLTDLAVISLFIQAITLFSIGSLCWLRRWLVKIHNQVTAALISYMVILWITWLVSEIGWQFTQGTQSNLLFYMQNYGYLFKNLFLTSVVTLVILGYGYWRTLWNKSMVLLLYLIILMVALFLTELLNLLTVNYQQHDRTVEHLLFLWRNLGVSAIVTAIVLRYFYMQHDWRQQTRAHAYARLQALQACIHPHFLFNTLNTIASLIRFDPHRAESAVEDLAELFRASFRDVHRLITIQDEIDICQQYLRIEGLRLDQRLQVAWQVDNLPRDALIPPLCLQPLLENAVYYGIQPLPEGGVITITSLRDNDQLTIEVENPCVMDIQKSRGLGMAQDNVRERLKVYFGGQGKLTIYQESNSYRASLRFPYQKTYENPNS